MQTSGTIPTAVPASGGDSRSYSKVVLISATLLATGVAAKYGGQFAALVSRVVVTVMIVVVGIFFALQIYAMNEKSAKDLVQHISKGATSLCNSLVTLLSNVLPAGTNEKKSGGGEE